MPITPENRLPHENASTYVPLSLEADSAMLHIVRDEPGFPIEPGWIDRLNKLTDVTPLKPEQRPFARLYKLLEGRNTSSNAPDPFSIAIHNENELWKEFGWSKPQHHLNRAYLLSPLRGAPQRIVDPRNQIEVLRFTYDHTGERMLETLDAYFDMIFLPAKDLRRLEDALKDHKGCLGSLLLHDPHMVTKPVDLIKSAVEKMIAKRKATARPSGSRAQPPSSTPNDIEAILPRRRAMLAMQSPEVQTRITDLAQFVRGGIDTLMIGVPEIMNCDQKALDTIIERASEQDGALPAHRVRMWLNR